MYSATIKNAFTLAANTANALFSANDAGLEIGKYPQASKNKLKAVIDVTTAVYNVDTSKELDLWTQVEKISPAVERYKAHKITDSTGNLNGNDRFEYL